MDTILIVGVETVVGANLAVGLSEERRVVGLSRDRKVALQGVEVSFLASESESAVRNALATAAPGRVILCGAAARSCWEEVDGAAVAGCVDAAECWARAAAEAGIPLTVISSDAVFSGPWMFHRENSTSLCNSAEAAAIRSMEERVLEIVPSALVVRTNAYGWSPTGDAGWLESTLSAVAARTMSTTDCLRHATPILATDLVPLLQDAWTHDLQGVYHISGSERTNPVQFIEALADQFELPVPLRCRVEPLSIRPEGFGRGETSLHTKKIRKALDVALPTVVEGLARLRSQQLTGFADRIHPTMKLEPARSRVA